MTRTLIPAAPFLKTAGWATLTATAGVAPVAFTATETLCLRAIVRASPDNVDDVVIGPDSSASWYPLVPGAEYLIEAPVSTQFNLAAWFAKSVSEGQNISVLYV